MIKTLDQWQQGEFGFFEGVPNELYAKRKAVNASVLKEMTYSPAHFYHRLTKGSSDSPAKSRGRAVHQAILEPKIFATAKPVPKFVGVTADGKETESANAKSVKEAKSRWFEENKGIPIYSQDDYDVAVKMSEAVKENSQAATLLAKECRNELCFAWKDPVSGVACKGRIDRLISHKDQWTVLDLKTIGTRATPEECARAVYKYQYNIGFRFYLRGLEVLYKEQHGEDAFRKKYESNHINNAIIIFIESEEPHGVRIFRLHSSWLTEADKQINEWMLLVKEGYDTGIWKGYKPQEEILQPLKYMFPEYE